MAFSLSYIKIHGQQTAVGDVALDDCSGTDGRQRMTTVADDDGGGEREWWRPTMADDVK